MIMLTKSVQDYRRTTGVEFRNEEDHEDRNCWPFESHVLK